MRRPTGKELFLLAAMWLLYLFIIWQYIERSVFNLNAIIFLIMGAVITHNYFDAKAYAKMKARDATTNARLEQKFGRWRLLVQWSPLLFFFSMLLLAWLVRKWALPLLIIAPMGLFGLSAWVSVQIRGPDPDDP